MTFVSTAKQRVGLVDKSHGEIKMRGQYTSTCSERKMTTSSSRRLSDCTDTSEDDDETSTESEDDVLSSVLSDVDEVPLHQFLTKHRVTIPSNDDTAATSQTAFGDSSAPSSELSDLDIVSLSLFFAHQNVQSVKREVSNAQADTDDSFLGTDAASSAVNTSATTVVHRNSKETKLGGDSESLQCDTLSSVCSSATTVAHTNIKTAHKEHKETIPQDEQGTYSTEKDEFEVEESSSDESQELISSVENVRTREEDEFDEWKKQFNNKMNHFEGGTNDDETSVSTSDAQCSDLWSTQSVYPPETSPKKEKKDPLWNRLLRGHFTCLRVIKKKAFSLSSRTIGTKKRLVAAGTPSAQSKNVPKLHRRRSMGDIVRNTSSRSQHDVFVLANKKEESISVYFADDAQKLKNVIGVNDSISSKRGLVMGDEEVGSVSASAEDTKIDRRSFLQKQSSSVRIPGINCRAQGLENVRVSHSTRRLIRGSQGASSPSLVYNRRSSTRNLMGQKQRGVSMRSLPSSRLPSREQLHRQSSASLISFERVKHGVEMVREMAEEERFILETEFPTVLAGSSASRRASRNS